MDMSTHSGSPSNNDANFQLTSEITDRIQKEVRALWDNPKYRYLSSECFSKFVSHETAPQEIRTARTVSKWLMQEKVNFFTNLRLRKGFEPSFQLLPRVESVDVLRTIRKFVIDIIGKRPEFSVYEGGFSSGASTSRSRTTSHPAGKYIGIADITAAALPHWERSKQLRPVWVNSSSDHCPRLVTGNEFFTVPKNSDIDRACCKEPDLNMYLQKGVGNHIRRSLRRVGLDLNNQTPNKDMAKIGSENGSLATIDLSSASDSVTCGLIELIFPPKWTKWMMDLRSEFTRIPEWVDEQGLRHPESIHRNEMLSSMGNGFTFEVESLVFFVLARTVAYYHGLRFSDLRVYGDDIICPSSMYPDLIWLLTTFGFSVNTKKSFHVGPFRESCGGHYHQGEDITPFYVRRPIERLTDLILLLNGVRRWSNIGGRILDQVLERFWHRHMVFVPNSLRGGRDYGSNTQLVTPDLPRKRLSVVQDESSENELGLYLQWLNASKDRSPSVHTLNQGGLCRLHGGRLIREDFACAPVDDAIEVSDLATVDSSDDDSRLRYKYTPVRYRNSVLFSGPVWLHELGNGSLDCEFLRRSDQLDFGF